MSSTPHFSYSDPVQLEQYLETLQKNLVSRRMFQNQVRFEIKDKVVLELGARDGLDFMFYKERAKELHAVEPDKSLHELAQKKTGDANILLSELHELPYEGGKFDVVVSKYTIPQSSQLPLIYNEVARVLKPGGHFIFLATHPFRQFYERTDLRKNYFNKEVIHPKLFEGLMTLNEYTYPFNEYLSSDFLSKFKIEYYAEKDDFEDLSSEQIRGDIYPCFFLIKSKKR